MRRPAHRAPVTRPSRYRRAVAILGPLLAFLGRFAGKLLNAALGWATTLLFGKVPGSRQWLLLVVALGSLVWVVLVVGIVLPDVGTTVLLFVPVPDVIDERWVRLAMLAGALILPVGIGIAGIFMVEPDDRPRGVGLVQAVLRGYPFAAVLALALALLTGIALVRKVRSLAHRWEDAHVPVVVKPGGYDRVLDLLEDVLDGAGLDVTRGPAPRALVAPAKLLEAVAGSGLRGLVPDRLMLLAGAELEVLVYPSDVSISGSKARVARARAAIAQRLVHAPAYLTVSAEAQRLEDRVAAVAQSPAPLAMQRTPLDGIDAELAALTVPFEEWETLYRQRLQVERDLLAAARRRDGRARAIRAAAAARPSAASQAVGLAGTALLAVYGVSLVLDRVLPRRRARD